MEVCFLPGRVDGEASIQSNKTQVLLAQQATTSVIKARVMRVLILKEVRVEYPSRRVELLFADPAAQK